MTAPWELGLDPYEIRVRKVGLRWRADLYYLGVEEMGPQLINVQRAWKRETAVGYAMAVAEGESEDDGMEAQITIVDVDK